MRRWPLRESARERVQSSARLRIRSEDRASIAGALEARCLLSPAEGDSVLGGSGTELAFPALAVSRDPDGEHFRSRPARMALPRQASRSAIGSRWPRWR